MYRLFSYSGSIRRITSWAALSVLCLAGRVWADESAKLGIEDVLTRWAEASAMEGAFEIRFESFEYDNTFGTEIRQNVILRGDGEGTLEYRKDPVPITDEFNEQKLTSEGDPYTLRQGGSVSWFFTSELAILADHDSRITITLQRHVEPNGWLTHRLWEALAIVPARVALNMTVDVDELQRDYHWEITEPLGSGVHIIGRPREEQLARQVSTVEHILDEATWLPMAYREISGGYEYVLIAQERIVPIDFDLKTAIEAVSEYMELERATGRLCLPDWESRIRDPM